MSAKLDLAAFVPKASNNENIKEFRVDIEHGPFMSDVVTALTATLDHVVGRTETRGYISTVGAAVGEALNKDYCKALDKDAVPRDLLARVLVDLKRRIDGDFYIIEDSETRIVLGNHRCPFGEKVRGHTPMCMMTSNIIGLLASECAGFARVTLDKTIAQGDLECRVIIDLDPDTPIEGHDTADRVREYYKP